LPDRVIRRQADRMSTPTSASSDLAELSTLRAQVDELTARVLVVAERYDDSSDSAIATELFAAERSLVSAKRTLDRAIAYLSPAT
jgi:hypothetical protein